VLRPAVIARKVSQCSKTWSGADAFAAFASVIQTGALPNSYEGRTFWSVVALCL
jgi:hypothetical protein